MKTTTAHELAPLVPADRDSKLLLPLLTAMSCLACLPAGIGLFYAFCFFTAWQSALVGLALYAYAAGGVLLLWGYTRQMNGLPQSRRFWITSALYQLPLLVLGGAACHGGASPLLLLGCLWLAAACTISIRMSLDPAR